MYKVTPGGNISIEGYYLTGPLEVVLRNVFSFYEIRIPSDGASGTVGGNFDVAAPLDESQYIMTVVNANGTSNGMNIIILTE